MAISKARRREYKRRVRERAKREGRNLNAEQKARDPEEHRAKRREYWARNADRINARRRKRQLYTHRTPEERAYLAALRCDPCAYCGGVAGTLDHIDPGGESGWENLTAACGACNTSKSNRSLLYAFAEWNGHWLYIPGLRA